MAELIGSRSIIASKILSGMLVLFAATGPARPQAVSGARAQPVPVMRQIPDEDMIELAKRSCHAQILGDYSILPDQVSIHAAARVDFRINVYGVVRQPSPGRPVSFVCMVSAYQGTGRSFGQVFNLQYSRIDDEG